MKSIKKLLAALLAVMLVLSLAVTAFATETPAETFNLTVQKDDTHTYNVYQIFTGDFAGDALGNIAKGENLKDDTDLSVALKALQTLNGKSDTEKLDYIKTLVDMTTPFTTVSSAQGVTLAQGYYLIADAEDPVEAPDSATLYIVKMIGNVEIERKPSTTIMEKKIVEGTTLTDVNETSIGKVIDYRIKATLPENLSYYKEYYLSFEDTLDDGLDFVPDLNGRPAITVKTGADVIILPKDYKLESEGRKFTLTIPDVKTLGLKARSEVIVTYQASLNKDALINQPNMNTATIIYSNDPNHSGDGDPSTSNDDNRHGTFPNQETETYTTAIKLIKVDQNNKKLTGAKFKLTGTAVKKVLTTGTEFVKDADGTYYMLKDNSYTTDAPTTETGILYASTTDKYKQVPCSNVVDTTESGVEATAFVDADGVLTFKGLSAGEYTISEVTAPDGYAELGEDIDVNITFNPVDKTFSATSDFMKANGNPTGAIAPNSEGYLCITVTNVEESLKLPDTGGIGTTIFYVIGSVLVVGAGVALITKKRMSM